ncbi:uncharacterized protein LOC111335190 [Stylophora pistillata]|uniref:Uncharacterized protein n=1 Tax=Stylophora pistillata TaxID=50429 RepID=A0A2B4RZF9_STYPI|nr:uncharacterized protein LOC111335190 [Stylophora pistillata]PFX21717.1 hypothetical protein AWC38_SpisGene13795 [Stylophora pistillata]
MDLSPKTNVEIDGETFDLLTLPSPNSVKVLMAKSDLLTSLDLASLADDLGKLGSFIRVAYNGVAGNTEIQIKVQKVGYKITHLADQSAVTVHNFKRASNDVIQEIRGAYQYLLDGLEEMAMETLSQLTDVAKEMATAAEKLHDDFEEVKKDAIDALQDTQRAKGTQEERKRALLRERKEFEMQKQKAQTIEKRALEAEDKASELYTQAEKRQEKVFDKQGSIFAALADGLMSIVGAVKAGLGGDFKEMMEKLESLGDQSRYKEAMKMANEEKMKHLDEMQKQRDMRRDALLQCIEFTEKIKSCRDDDALADAAINALHNSIGALKSLSAIMMNAAQFWHQMQSSFGSLAKGNVQRLVKCAMKGPEETRLEVWTGDPFKRKVLREYIKWLAIVGVCEEYMKQIKETRKDLYSYLTENPTIEEAKKNVRKLADKLAADLKKANEELAEKEKEAQEERKSLEDSK